MISRIRIHPFVRRLRRCLPVRRVACRRSCRPALEELVVTATLREAPLRACRRAPPCSMRARCSRRRAAFRGRARTRAEPQLGGGTSRPRYFQLRGIGELEQYQGAPNPSVGFLIDDIDFSGIGMPATLFDVAAGRSAARAAGHALRRQRARRPHVSVRSAPADARAAARGGRRRRLRHAPRRALWPAALLGGADGMPGASLRTAMRGDGFRRNAFLDATTPTASTRLLCAASWPGRSASTGESGSPRCMPTWTTATTPGAIDNSRVTQSDEPGRDAQRSLGGAARARLSRGGFDVRAP